MFIIKKKQQKTKTKKQHTGIPVSLAIECPQFVSQKEPIMKEQQLLIYCQSSTPFFFIFIYHCDHAARHVITDGLGHAN